MSGDKKVVIETVKLLMQVAWADGEVGETEAAQVMSAAGELHLDERNLALLGECLRGDRKLPPPDLGFLRQHADAVLAAAEKMIMADQDISEGESEVLHELRALLGVD